ncbi:MAG: PepSY-like domain-containing protein [Bacteroidales bacterium]
MKRITGFWLVCLFVFTFTNVKAQYGQMMTPEMWKGMHEMMNYSDNNSTKTEWSGSSNQYEHIVPINQIPQALIEFVKTNFDKNITIRKARLQSNNVYELNLSNGNEITFHSSGDWHHIDGEGNYLSESLLKLMPSNVMDYVKKNYSKAKIKELSKCSEGWEVEISTSKINDATLMFYPNGTFMKIEEE